ncbi:putative prolyl endopeptidase-like [Capsicum annuum]|nr:putative prolyl endopeptidase-like [Capsicum annuum]
MRNKLASSRAEDLVFVYYNLCLLSRKKEKYINGPSKYWDLGGDHFNIDESINELVELSIDERQLEGVFFENEVENLEKNDNMEEIEEGDL